MAVPRAKTSKARTRRRRGVNMHLVAPQMVECANCGFYRGRQVIKPEVK